MPSGAVISLPEELVYAAFLHSMMPICFHNTPFARAAASQTHNRVICGTNFAKYLKPEGFYNCRLAGL